MEESTARLKHLYGQPATNEQIKLYFDTLLRTYIEMAEKHPPDTIKMLNWYSRRPLKFIFYNNNTTVCFTLIGNADIEGAEKVDNVTEMTSCPQNGFTFITSGTSFNGQKLYSIDSAIREAMSRLRVELKETNLPNIQSNLNIAGKELEKAKPSIEKLKSNYDAICQTIKAYHDNENSQSDSKDLSPFGKMDMCPLIDAYVNKLKTLEGHYIDISSKLQSSKEVFETFKDNTNESFKTMRQNKSFAQTKKVNVWIIIGIILSFLLGIFNILLKLLPNINKPILP